MTEDQRKAWWVFVIWPAVGLLAWVGIYFAVRAIYHAVS